ncbi:DUF420 domain-containing protein [Kiritimatiellaeota bacterium B1221]|nr:DUF420 domain-containing protein [Kiritimatiellaeota bacterium B1221]
MPDNPLPTLNATLNLIALIFLLLGRFYVKRGNVRVHSQMMTGALITSAFFLTSYLYYHFVVGSPQKYDGTGFMRIMYFLILFPHILLAAIQVPFIVAVAWSAWTKRFILHVKLVKWVWPVWVYVSITGVLVYLMLYIF